MKRISITGGTGPATALTLVEAPDLEPGPGQVRIRVRAAGINRPDLLQREGRYPPPPGAPDTLGLEVAGEIDRLGDGVTDRAIGDRVCALLGGGGYADQAVVDARHLFPLPDDLDFVAAAALPETLSTVFANVFEDGRLQAGETLLIHGARASLPSISRSDTPLGRWLKAMLERGVHRNAAVVALANKLARIAWAALRKGATFERSYPVAI